MGLRDALQVLAPVLWAAALALVVSRKRLVAGLRRDRALDPSSARPVPARGLTGFWRRKLASAGVLRSADGERFWLDAPAWEAYWRIRRRRGLTIAIPLAAALLLWAALSSCRS